MAGSKLVGVTTHRNTAVRWPDSATMHDETVEVVVPFSPEHTPEEYLQRALGSIEDQTVPADPIVVTDDKQQGPAWARNVGLERASVRFVAFCDADDYWKEQKLEKQLDALADTGAALCLTQTVAQDSGETNVEPFETATEFAEDVLLGRSESITSSLLVDTDTVQPRFGEDLICYEDFLFALQAATEGVCFVPDEVTVIHRHSGGLSARELPVDTRLASEVDYFEQAIEAFPELEAHESEYLHGRYHRAGRAHYFEGNYERSADCLKTALSYRFSHRTFGALLVSSLYAFVYA
jgi:glycosyltransferase involved in cell wall biosynthesis